MTSEEGPAGSASWAFLFLVVEASVRGPQSGVIISDGSLILMSQAAHSIGINALSLIPDTRDVVRDISIQVPVLLYSANARFSVILVTELAGA